MIPNQDFPEEYTDGYVIFMGQRFIVDPRVLIPRFETEELVKYCLKLLKENPDILTIADIGTGSGIIPISLAKKTDRTLQVIATDMSADALDLARENSIKITPFLKDVDNLPPEKGGEKVEGIMGGGEIETNPPVCDHPPSQGGENGITFLPGDLVQPLIAYFGRDVPDALLITANLPYVREKEINSGLIHEPRMAFLGGVQTGFELYERFFDQLLAWKNRPKKCYVVIEFGLWQRDIAETVFQKLDLKYSFFSDLRGIERFAHVCL